MCWPSAHSTLATHRIVCRVLDGLRAGDSPAFWEGRWRMNAVVLGRSVVREVGGESPARVGVLHRGRWRVK